jgi:multiple antibiotic resistance protein
MEWGDLVLAFVPLFVVVDPFASIGIYLGLTPRLAARQRYAIALRAAAFAAVVLLAFAFAGQAILRYLGIELYSLRVAGGLLLTLIGLRMLSEGEEIPHGEVELPTGGVHREARHDPSLVPLGLPLLAGPGAITLVIVQGTRFSPGILAGSIVAAMVGSLLVLMAAARASHVIGDNGRRIITRIMGLLTVAFAVQYVFDGINGWLATR